MSTKINLAGKIAEFKAGQNELRKAARQEQSSNLETFLLAIEDNNKAVLDAWKGLTIGKTLDDDDNVIVDENDKLTARIGSIAIADELRKIIGDDAVDGVIDLGKTTQPPKQVFNKLLKYLDIVASKAKVTGGKTVAENRFGLAAVLGIAIDTLPISQTIKMKDDNAFLADLGIG